MNKLKLDHQDIVDLIFDKKIVVDGYLLEFDERTLKVINEIQDRLIYGKTTTRKNSVLCKPNNTKNSRS